MICENCGSEKVLLFIHSVCNRCEPPTFSGAEQSIDDSGLFYGWVVWRNRYSGAQEYIFRSPDDARRWRKINDLNDCPIKQFVTRTEIKWRRSIGSVRDLEFADRLYELFHTKDEYEPRPYRGHLMGGD